MPERGRVYFIKGMNNIQQASLKELAKRLQKSSSQVPQVDIYRKDQGLIEHPYTMTDFIWFYENNSTMMAVANQIGTDVSSGKIQLVLKEGKKERKSERDMLESFINKPNGSVAETLNKLIKELIIDWCVCGNFAVEVVRNRLGNVAEIYRVPIHTLWVHKSGLKYRQERGQDRKWFKRFGLEYNIDSVTGERTRRRVNRVGSEILYVKGSSRRNDYYGVPNLISCTGHLFGMQAIRDRNLSRDFNHGFPGQLLTLTGPWEDGSDVKITEFLETEARGPENAHKVMVMTMPEGCGMRMIEGGVEQWRKNEQDKEWYEFESRQIQMVYSMPPYRISDIRVGELGKSVAEETTKIYGESVITPLKEDVQAVLDLILDSDIYEVKLKEFDYRLILQRIDMMSKAARVGAMRPIDFRAALGLDNISEEQEPHLYQFYKHKVFQPIAAPLDETVTTPGAFNPEEESLSTTKGE